MPRAPYAPYFNLYNHKPCIVYFLKKIYFLEMSTTSRRPRIHIPNTIHHVMIRGNDRQKIFFEKSCFEKFLKIISDSARKFDHKISCYCLMTNHAHLLVHVHQNALSTVMQYINYRYVRWVNYKYKKIGHLFQDRYRSIEVSNESYFIHLCRYIHENPVTAGITKSIDEYTWSSHRYYVNKNTPEWLQIDFMLSAIKNKTRQDYIQFISESIHRDSWKPAMYISDDGKIILNEDIVRQYRLENNLREIQKKKILQPEVISSIVCKHFNIELNILSSNSRNREISRLRTLAISYLMQYSELNIVDIAKRFHRTHGTLLRQLTALKTEKNRYFPLQILKKIQTYD